MSVNLDFNISLGQIGLDSVSGSSGGKGESWLVAIAKAMGAKLGEKAEKMTELSDKLGGLDSKKDAKEFSKTQMEFQAESQMFSMLSNTISTAIKSIGEGLTSAARKQ
ncbi:hypothetical protein MNO14_15405 [Luteimonas sp. S4-F44]|uniref:hypothetical protein n=1 Tax=Luteimonas sp. S4-F44 TaxID=2925842 RepID=UPI001F52E223|nr:hypothetical protein [Luteimonas sp. S4-F44]UNK42301.1 hypothetical protein MNO14_15405 [Luteimonas sp. S4-F44]